MPIRTAITRQCSRLLTIAADFVAGRKLNDSGALFAEVDEHGHAINSEFRPCDIEIALF